MQDFDIKNKRFRYERKFVVPYLETAEVEQLIANNSYFFREAFPERTNNNIYFDTIDEVSYFDNVLGNADRVKIRIRWYGELEKVENPVLELKIRRGLVGAKLSYPLVPFTLDTSLEEMQQVFAKSNLPDWLMETLKTQRFAIVNNYKRRYYISACGRYRITLDSDLAYWGIFNQSQIHLTKKITDDHLILELKYAVWEQDAAEVTTQFPFRMTKSSKYVTAFSYFKLE